MEYIIVQPQGDLDSRTRAYGITRELYNITAPEHLQEGYQNDGIVFPLIAHPTSGLWAMQVETQFEIYVHSQVTLDRLVALFPIMDTNEIAALTQFITTSNLITFGQIIPSDVIVRDEEFMTSEGWFQFNTNGEG